MLDKRETSNERVPMGRKKVQGFGGNAAGKD